MTAGGRSAPIVEEQAALRRVATLVARAAPPEEVFARVAAETGQLLEADFSLVSRYDADGTATVVGTWARTGANPFPAGQRVEPEGRSVHSLVFRTGRPARLDSFEDVSGQPGELARERGFRSGVGAPISVEGRLWGAVTVACSQRERLPADTEARLVGFTELVATAIANTQARVELRCYAEEQAALRRVATLVARATEPEEVFAAVAAEVGRVLDTDYALVLRYEPDDAATIVGAWTRSGAVHGFLGLRVELTEGLLGTLVFRTNRPARVEDHGRASGVVADIVRELGIRSVVGAPISVEGRLWGVMLAACTRKERLQPGTEGRLAGFTELVGTALANAQARVLLRDHGEEQAALRRVATLVARGVAPGEVFDAVVSEAHRALDPTHTVLVRYGVDGSFTVMARNTAGLEVGQRVPPEDQSVAATVFQTRRAARLDLAWDAAETDSVVRWAPEVRSAVSAPIVVQARLWGAMIAAWTGPTPPTADAEDRLCEFTELTASAIANADNRAELAASRARVVAAGDESRRRIERDLHDGIQQQLVSLGLELRLTEAEVRPDHHLKAGLAKLTHMLAGTIEDLRELSRGIHPTVLSNGGLGPGLRSLAHRSAVPVQLEVGVEGRLQEPIESAAYYVVSEALTNAAKHARATLVRVGVQAHDGFVWLSISDDGIGGADPGRGSGLVGLRDRIEALSGTIDIASPPGGGTSYSAKIPIDGPPGPTTSR
ncbi:MAG: hypothetical protein QOG64_607 [Acidimicrobiaceae bacterium]|nr:hypothetical protein [Acidimicrobiaceae bacterium]